jgi:hypothetical protein
MAGRFLTPCGGGSKYLKRCQGPSFPPIGQSAPTGIYLLPCDTCAWFAAIYICGSMQCYPPPPGSNYAPIQGKVTIRSSKPIGTVLTVNIDQSATAGCAWTYLKSDCVTFAQMMGTFNVTVGQETGGQWKQLGSIVVGGQPTLYVFINSFLATADSASPPYCFIPEYGLPVASELPAGHPVVSEFGGVVLNTTNPGPVKWRDVVALANGIAGTGYVTDDECRHQCFGTLPAPGYYNPAFTMALFDGFALFDGIFVAVDTIDWFSAHVSASSACFQPVQGNISDGISAGQYTRRSYQKAIPIPPTSVTIDSVGFTLPVSYQQMYSGLVVDGTHIWDDTQETDMDTIPSMQLADSASDETLFFSGTSRISFGHYNFTGVRFVVRAPSTRRLNVWPATNFSNSSSAFRNSAWKQQTADIAVAIGAPDSIDIVRINVNDNHYHLPPVKAGSPILGIGGAALRSRILDYAGRFRDFNVVPTATNSVTAALSSSGTNFYSTPSLGGTNPKSAVAGFADFSDLYILGVGRHYQITWTSGVLNVGAWNRNWLDEISIYPDLVFEATGAINAGVPVDIKVDLKDSLGGALVPSSADSLTLSGQGSFSGFGTVTPIAGVATFSGTFPSAGIFTIQVVTSGANYDGPGVSGLAPVTIVVMVT